MTDTLNTDVLAARAREVLVDLICADSPTLYRSGVQVAVERDMAAVSSRPSRVVAAMLRFAKEATPQSDGAAIPVACTVPPPGWSCTRSSGHEGPCAAVPDGDLEDEIADAIDDSLDIDWTGSVGARHVMALLRKKGIVA